jgi:hypothetical protein
VALSFSLSLKLLPFMLSVIEMMKQPIEDGVGVLEEPVGALAVDRQIANLVVDQEATNGSAT